ncbi:MAG: ABC transporter permease [Microthrixaceae bacterium]
MSQIGAMAGPGVEVTDGATAAVHAQESLTRSFTLVRVLVTGFGVLALLVGMVTVANSLTLLHAQRRRMFAGFRLVGASRGQLRRAALGEAVILAAVSALVGVPLGLLLAVLIERALGTMGTAVPTAGPLLTPQAALRCGDRPAGNAHRRMATRSQRLRRAPIEAVAETEPRSRRRWSPMVVATSRAAVLAVAAAAVGTIAGATRDTAIAAAVTFVAVLILGLLPTLLARAVSATIRVPPLRPRPLRVVAARDALRNPRRTAATTAAVLLAAAVVSSLAVFLQSFTASLDDAVDGLVTADLVVDSETFTRGGLPADLVEQLGFVEGVEASSGWQLGRGTVNGFAVRMTGLDGASATEVVAPGFVGGTPDGIEPDSAWISESLAERSGLGVGDLLPVTFYSGGFENLEVSAATTTVDLCSVTW